MPAPHYRVVGLMVGLMVSSFGLAVMNRFQHVSEWSRLMSKCFKCIGASVRSLVCSKL